jgi:hypothetical protein
MEKLKTEGAVVRSLRHDLDLSYNNEQGEKVYYRKTRDDELAKKNAYWGQKEGVSQDELFQQAMKRWRSKLPEKVRKNAVVGAQCIFSFSHELLKDKNFKPGEYFIDCHQFVKKHFGAENVFNWALHLDEKTPHVSFHFLPIDENGKLNARKIFGNKKTLSEWQDKVHEEIGKKHNLDRGIKKTNIIHQTLNRFYGQLKNLDEDLDKLKLEKKEILEDWEDYFVRTKTKLKSFVEPMLKPLASLEAEIKRFEKKREDEEKEYYDKFTKLNVEREDFEKEKKDHAKNVREEIQKGKQELYDRLYKQVFDDLEKQFLETHDRYNEIVDYLDTEQPLKFKRSFSDGSERTVDFKNWSKQQLADELAKWYLDDETKVRERKKEIERDFERNRERSRDYER